MADSKWREVNQEDAEYVIIFRAGGYDTSAYFYKNIRDVKWALKNSWFDPKEATVAKLLHWEVGFKKRLCKK